jgi:hypothetical protein
MFWKASDLITHVIPDIEEIIEQLENKLDEQKASHRKKLDSSAEVYLDGFFVKFPMRNMLYFNYTPGQ